MIVRAIATAGVIMLAATLPVRCEEPEAEPTTGLALGLHGFGGIHAEGHPVLSLVREGYRLDLTPVIDHSKDEGTTTGERSWYGLDAAYVWHLRELRGVSVGVQALAGYRYSNSTQHRVYGDVSYSRRDEYDRYRLAVGPDLEYPVPGVAGLTVGAAVLLLYERTELDSVSGEIVEATTTDRITLKGEVLTLRYVF